jgi:rod shape-determining protein MreD
MATLIAIPLMGILVILQTTIVSRMPLLQGTADLVLLTVIAWALQKPVRTAWEWSIIGGLMVNLASALPLGIPLVAYGLSTGMAIFLRRRVWQVPLLAMFVVTFFGTLITQSVSLVALRLIGSPIPPAEAFIRITLPSLVLNLILSVPTFALFSELAHWIYPEEIEI